MKKTIFILIPILVLFSVFFFSAYNTSVGENRLFCDQNGDFTILVVSDPQCDTKKQWYEARDELETLIERSNPDFVMINGDMNSQNKVSAEYLDVFLSPILSRDIFWATNSGNHDPYNKQNYDLYKSYKNCLNSKLERGNPSFEADRPMNYVIPVFSNDGKKTVFAIYALDSGTQNKNGYEGLTKRQIDWYRGQSAALKRQNGGRAVTSLMCLHIPITQTLDMFYSNSNSAAATAKKAGGLYNVYGITNQSNAAVKDYYCENNTYVAESFLNVTSPLNDRGIFNEIIKQNDVKILVFGHEHKTNIAGSYKGVVLSFAGKLSTGCYSDNLCRGGRVVRFNQSDPQNFTTEWLAALPSSCDQPPIYSSGQLAK